MDSLATVLQTASLMDDEGHSVAAARKTSTLPKVAPKPKITVTMEESILKEFDEVLDKEEQEEDLLHVVSTDNSCNMPVGNTETDTYANVASGMPIIDAVMHRYPNIPDPDYDIEDDDCYVNLGNVQGMMDSVNQTTEPDSNYANLEDIQQYIRLPAAAEVDSKDLSNRTSNCSASGVRLSDDRSAQVKNPLENKLPLDSDAMSIVTTRPLPLKMAQKQGHLHRLKVMDCGKKSKKSWSLSFVLLYDDKLHFFKDQKIANRPRSLASLGRPETSLDLHDATVKTLTNADKNKKEVLEVTTANSTQYWMHHIDSTILQHWQQTLENNITVLKSRTNSSVPAADKTAVTMSFTNPDSRQPLSGERAKYADRLKTWLKRRPTCDSLRAHGIYKDVVFGTQLSVVCENEGNQVPRFIQECIIAVENRGLTLSGVYRTNGNLSAVQKLRMMVDHNEYYDLISSEWDINVVTSALKLYLRELPEPLFTFQLYEEFLATLTLGNRQRQSSTVRQLLKSLPENNYETLRLLFCHLNRVVQHSQENKMLPQNLAIVFGPTLLRARVDTGNLTVSLVQQGQLIEFILLENQTLFQ